MAQPQIIVTPIAPSGSYADTAAINTWTASQIFTSANFTGAVTASIVSASLLLGTVATASYSNTSLTASYAITTSPLSLVIHHPFICTVKTIFDGMKFPKNVTIIGCDIYCEVDPLGSDLIIKTLKDGVDVDTLTLTAGTTFISSAITSTFTSANKFGLRISQIGSDVDNPGDNLFITIHYI